MTTSKVRRLAIAVVCAALMAPLGFGRVASAQSTAPSWYGSSSGGSLLPATALSATAGSVSTPSELVLWTNPKTGVIYTKPGRGRVKLILPSSVLAAALQQKQQQLEQTQDQLKSTQAQLKQDQQALASDNVKLKQQVNQIYPAWQDYIVGFKDKVTIGGWFFGDWALYTHTSYGPQFLTQVNPPGPGNNLFNSFDITRAYLNFYFSPTKDWTLRITPNLYRTTGATTNQAFGNNSAIGSDLTGDLGVRIKYAYVQWKAPFNNSLVKIDALSKDSVIFGELPEPLVPWEEDLYGFRYVNLVTWNFYGFSSTYPGMSIGGPVTFGPEHLQYIDYNIGVFGDGNFHNVPSANTVNVMGRVSIYPLGALWRFQGLGITSFYDYGYPNTTPDAINAVTPAKGSTGEVERLAEIVHYTGDNWQLGFEWDWGRNSISVANQFSATGPPQAFGLAQTASPTLPASVILRNANYAALATAFLANGRAYQQGFSFFGHYHIPHTKFTLFGWLNQFEPNTDVNVNPFDLQRAILGISYQYNEYLRFAFDTQNLLYYHNQFNVPVSYAKTFGFVPPAGFKGKTIPDVVIPDVHSFFLNVEFLF